MKTIMVDMDDVITEGGYLYLINKYFNTNHHKEDTNDFYMYDFIPDRKKFFKYFINNNLYDYSKLIDNAVKVLKYLNGKYEVYIATAYIYNEIPKESGKIALYKHNYLVKNLPFIDPHNFILINNKGLLNCDIKIDDKLDNLKNAHIKILFTAFHNKNLSDSYLKQLGIIRANNWLEIKSIIDRLEKECE